MSATGSLSALASSLSSGGHAPARGASGLADDRSRFRSLLGTEDGGQPAAGASDHGDQGQSPQQGLSRWLDGERESFSNSLAHLSEIIQPAGPLQGTSMQLVMQAQLEIVNMSVHFELMAHVGSKGMQNFETFFKNQG